jgi:hypothetical protein
MQRENAVPPQPSKTPGELRLFSITNDGFYWILRETESAETERFVTKLSAQVAASTRAKQCSPSKVRLFNTSGIVETEWGY